MAVHADRPLRFARRSLQVLLCSLVAHAAAYGALVPRDSVHGYMGVYNAVIAGLSVAAVSVFMLALIAVLVGRERRLLALFGRPARRSPATHGVTLLVGAALGVLVAQESLERSLETGSIEPASASIGTWLMALVTIVVVAVAFILLERSCGGLCRALLVARATLPRAPARISTPCSAPRREQRRNSLADFRGLRAPPAGVA